MLLKLGVQQLRLLHGSSRALAPSGVSRRPVRPVATGATSKPSAPARPQRPVPPPAPAGSGASSSGDQAADWLRIIEAEKTGTTVEAKVKSFNKGGLVVMVGDVRGFIPYNQVAALKKGDSGDLDYLVGQTLSCRVISADAVGSRKEVVLSERKAKQADTMARIRVGSNVRGVVQSVEDYGAFVELSDYPGVVGLVHKSELSWDAFMTVDQVVQSGQMVQAQVLEVDAVRCRLALSMKALQQDPLKLTIAGADWKATAQIPPEIQRVIDGMRSQPGVQSLTIGRQAVESKVMSQELGLYLVKDAASASDGLYTVVARYQSVMQEVYISANTMGRDAFKSMLRRVASGQA